MSEENKNNCPCCYPCTGGDSSSDNSQQSTHQPWVPQPSWTEFIRGQELLSTLDDTEKGRFGVCGKPMTVYEEYLELEIGSVSVLHIPHLIGCKIFDASVYPLYWESSNPKIVLVQPTQALSQAQIMALGLGQVKVQATCIKCGCQEVYAWYISVVEKKTSEDGPGSDSSNNNSDCNCSCKPKPEKPKDKECCYYSPVEKLRDELCNGGDVVTNPSRPRQLDLKGREIVMDGIFASLNLGKKDTLLSNGTVFEIKAYSGLSIEGEGKIVSEAGGVEAFICARVESGGELTIDGCRWFSNAPGTIITSEGGIVYIRGGIFEADLEGQELLGIPWALQGQGIDPTEFIKVTGGKWMGYNPSLTRYGNFVPPGYEVGIFEGEQEGMKVYLVEAADAHPRGREERETGEVIYWPTYYGN